MTVRETSLQAYFAIEQQLPASRQTIYAAICLMREPSTSGEVFESMLKRNPNTPLKANLNQVRARFTMLRDEGVIVEVGKRQCKVTGYNGILWLPSGRGPVAKKRTMTRKESKAEILQELRELYKVSDTNKDAIQRMGIRIKNEL
jgi:hypothetical protein